MISIDLIDSIIIFIYQSRSNKLFYLMMGLITFYSDKDILLFEVTMCFLLHKIYVYHKEIRLSIKRTTK